VRVPSHFKRSLPIQVLIVQCEQWGCEKESWEVMTGYWDRELTVMSTNRGRNLGGGGTTDGKRHTVHEKKSFSALKKCLIIEPNGRKLRK
jgi:hypothetical protein